MSRDIEMLERLGGFIAEDLGDGPSEERLIFQRRDFLAVVETGKAPRRGVYFASAAAAAVLMAALAVLFFTGNRSDTIQFWIGENGIEGQEGQWVRTETTASLPIHFEGGSAFTFSPNSSARMVSVTEKEVRVDLALGNLHCDINKNDITKWRVVAGPYTITVTGTVFNAHWEPHTGNLNVNVKRGSVLVSGADLSEHGVRLAKGDHLRVDGEQAVISLRGDTATEELIVSEEALPTEDEAALNSDWERLTSHKPREMRRALRRGIKGAATADPEKMSLDVLWKAASKARYTKNADTAEALLMTVKRRFPGTRQAKAVSFLMGRIQLELKGSPKASLKWFKQYLNESPRGPLAEEALGRMIDACNRSGDIAGAKRYAIKYRSKYDNGLFDDLAASVLSD